MIGHKNVIGIITMSLLIFIIAACNSSSQDVYEELSKTEITDNSSEVDDLSNVLRKSNDESEYNNGDESEKENTYSTIERNDSHDVVQYATIIMTISNT